MLCLDQNNMKYFPYQNIAGVWSIGITGSENIHLLTIQKQVNKFKKKTDIALELFNKIFIENSVNSDSQTVKYHHSWRKV